MKRNHRTDKQAGVVSILTVLMFSILISVLLTGFARIMLQEQQDTLRDDLSKSAYNSAQSGVEDAKRALRFCAQNPTSMAPGANCGNLYQNTCPGFNAGGAFSSLGINAPTSSGTVIGSPDASQRYTCVIISRSENIETTLGGPDTTNNTAMYKLSGLGGQNFDTVQISWQQGDITLTGAAGLSSFASNGNPRQPDWPATYPAVMRVNLLTSDDTMTNVQQKQTFVYPTNGSGASGSYIPFGSVVPRTYATCNMTTIYRCSQSFNVGGTPGNRYVLLQPFYKGTNASVTLRNGGPSGTIVPIGGNEQVTVDSTGAAANVFRRVQVRLSPGDPIASSTSLDVGNSICKDFFVGAKIFENSVCDP